MVNQLIQDVNKLDKGDSLLLELKSLNFKRGVSSLEKLCSVKTSIKSILSEVSDTSKSLLNVERVDKLVEDLYLQGLAIYSSIVDILSRGGDSSSKELNSEIEELQNRLSTETSDVVRKLLEERLGANKRNLSLSKGSTDRLEELLCYAGLCYDSLKEVYLKLPNITNLNARDSFDKAVIELKSRLEYAERVKKEYERQGI